MKVILRYAKIEDAALLRHWDQQPHVIAASGEDYEEDFDWETELSLNVDWYECLIAEVGGRPVGILQIIDPALEETHYWGDCGPNLRAIDIWIGDREDLGRGYGTEMMQLALARCFDAGAKAVLIDPLVSNVRAHRFYERLGFKKIERRMFGADDCFVYRLERADWLHTSSLPR